ncbi:MAG: hypothetical protein ACE1ZA_10935, partial [Pseudomonadales bacterium]
DAHRWLDTGVEGTDLMTLFESAIPMTLEAIPVSTYVNNARNKDARCIDPIGAPILISESRTTL